MGYVNLTTDARSFLQEVARMSYGVGSNDGQRGGSGRIGLLSVNGSSRVIKYNTHWHERWSGPSATKEMYDGANALRRALINLAESAGLGEKEIQSIRDELGLKGGAVEPKKLLDRTTVASVVKKIGGDEVWADALRGRDMAKDYRTIKNSRYQFLTDANHAAGDSHVKAVEDLELLNADRFSEILETVKADLPSERRDALESVLDEVMKAGDFRREINRGNYLVDKEQLSERLKTMCENLIKHKDLAKVDAVKTYCLNLLRKSDFGTDPNCEEAINTLMDKGLTPWDLERVITQDWKLSAGKRKEVLSEICKYASKELQNGTDKDRIVQSMALVTREISREDFKTLSAYGFELTLNVLSGVGQQLSTSSAHFLARLLPRLNGNSSEGITINYITEKVKGFHLQVEDLAKGLNLSREEKRAFEIIASCHCDVCGTDMKGKKADILKAFEQVKANFKDMAKCIAGEKGDKAKIYERAFSAAVASPDKRRVFLECVKDGGKLETWFRQKMKVWDQYKKVGEKFREFKSLCSQVPDFMEIDEAHLLGDTSRRFWGEVFGSGDAGGRGAAKLLKLTEFRCKTLGKYIGMRKLALKNLKANPNDQQAKAEAFATEFVLRCLTGMSANLLANESAVQAFHNYARTFYLQGELQNVGYIMSEGLRGVESKEQAAEMITAAMGSLARKICGTWSVDESGKGFRVAGQGADEIQTGSECTIRCFIKTEKSLSQVIGQAVKKYPGIFDSFENAINGNKNMKDLYKTVVKLGLNEVKLQLREGDEQG